MPQRALPTVSNPATQQDVLANQRVALGQGTKLAPTPIAPWNFAATNQRGGILLSWSSLTGSGGSASSPSAQQLPKADGYEILKSATGDFSPGAYTSIPIRDPAVTSYFDSVGGAPQTFSYKIRGTNGTQSNPYAVHGVFSGVIKHTSIDSSDTSTVPTTVHDTVTNDKTQKRAGNWRSGTLYPGNQ